MLANQRELVSATRDIKNFVTDVHRWVCHPYRLNVVIFKFCAIWIWLLLSPNEINFSKVTALQSAQGRGTATVQQIGGGGDSVVLGERSS